MAWKCCDSLPELNPCSHMYQSDLEISVSERDLCGMPVYYIPLTLEIWLCNLLFSLYVACLRTPSD